MDVVPIAEAKTHLTQLVARVEREQDQVTITRNGRPAAVLVSTAEWDSVQETFEVLSDHGAVVALAEASGQVDKGEVYSTEEILADLALSQDRTA